MAPDLVEGYRAMEVVHDNPQWWMVEIVDGSGAHLSNYNAMKLRFDNKILTMKEEGDSSTINQAYDKQVAKVS